MFVGLMFVLFQPLAAMGTRAHTAAVNKHLSVGQNALSFISHAPPDTFCVCVRLILLVALCLFCFSFIHIFICVRDEGDSNIRVLLK